MLGTLVSGITAPSSGAEEIRLACQTSSTRMVIAAGVKERPSTKVAQWMRNKPDLRPTTAAQGLNIAAGDSAATSTATGRIKPVNQPIKTLCECRW
jgi:hypothetical protein